MRKFIVNLVIAISFLGFMAFTAGASAIAIMGGRVMASTVSAIFALISLGTFAWCCDNYNELK